MFHGDLSLPELFSKGFIKICNEKLNSTIQKNDFLEIDEEFDLLKYPKLLENIKKSHTIMINQFLKYNKTIKNQFFIICFKQTIIIINRSFLSFLQNLFSSSTNLIIYFFPGTKDVFEQDIKITQEKHEINLNFKTEIRNFVKIFQIDPKASQLVRSICYVVCQCISGYLIKESYFKSNKNRLNSLSNFFIQKSQKIPEIKKWKQDEFIELRVIESTNSSSIILLYHIEKGKLFALKKINKRDVEYSKLKEREQMLYLKLNYPLLPKFYGTAEDNNDYSIIEYINGSTLLDIRNLNLNINDKYAIIFELLIIFHYLHSNKFIYRDLKPNNIMIDSNKTAILIDFDRMISFYDDSDDHTTDFVHNFFAPEIENGESSAKSDIYSLGMMIYYIFNEKEPEMKDKTPIFDPQIHHLYEICTCINSQQRPSIDELYDKFVSCNYFNNNEFLLSNNSHLKFLLGFFYLKKDMEKAIYYLSLSAEQNNSNAQYYLGFIYFSRRRVSEDISKSIHYLTLSANQNNFNAQFLLGYNYYLGKYFPRDINKAIYYLSLAANQNYSYAQYFLAVVYLESDSFNINKAIHYFTLASEQNHTNALFQLGFLYLFGENIPQDINKAINYFALAADHHNSEAQYFLGEFYLSDEYVPIDVDKAIYYYLLAAEHNHSDAQLKLGKFYYIGEFVSRDVNKGIKYLSLASDQDNSEAQYLLGVIYFKGEQALKEINKAIHYFTLASNHNHAIAQYFLGEIYLKRKYNKQDINKAINYLALSANQNYMEAQFKLGTIYFKDKYIKRDIKKLLIIFLLQEITIILMHNIFLALFIIKKNIILKILVNQFIILHSLLI